MRIAAIVPVHNEAWNIRRIAYNLLYTQDYSRHQLEKIVVVCSGCTDGTDTIVKEIAGRNEKVFPIIEKVRSGKTHALNLAIKALVSEAKESEAVAFLSGDVVPQRESLAKLANALQGSSVGCAIAHPIPLNSKRELAGKLVNVLWGLHNEMNSIGWHKVTGEMFAVRREVVGELPEGVINDDLYIEYLVSKHKLQFAYVPEAFVYIWGPESLMELLEQRRRVNRGHRQFAKEYKAQHMSINSTIKLISILVSKYQITDAAVFGLLEGCSRIIASFDSLRRKYSPVWTMISTSKGGAE